MLNKLQDDAMFALIGRQIIYNVAWEDPRIDAELLDIRPDDVMLMLTTGGCNVLDMLLEGPKKIVAADLNPRQNALLELKLVCIRELEYEQFFQIFAKSNEALFRELYSTRLRPKLSAPAVEFWDANKSFFKNVFWSGASGFAAYLMLNLAKVLGVGGLIAECRSTKSLEEQRAVYARYASRIAALASMLNFTRRLWCPLIAVPANQLHLFDGNVVKIAVDNLFLNTHIASDNYFYHGYMYGEYTRECCPRYLQQQHWETLKARVNRVEVRTGTLQNVAASYPDGTFSRYILLDHMDWMPMSMVLDEWAVFVVKARRDARFLWRSFASKQHIAPLKYLDFHPANVEAALAMYPDRVAMYNSTHLATLSDGFTIVPRVAYAPPATLRDDLNVLFHNWVHPISGGDHQSRLESFYKGQAASYDTFRHRFLHGRVPMIEAMPTPVGGVWVDLGGGTAANLEHLAGAIDSGLFKKVVVLDLCRPLIDVARQRVEAHGWGKVVDLVVGDATVQKTPGMPSPGTVDVITMSYSLTMIPDWQAALQNAYSLLRPGGYFAISDFTVTPEHSLFTRTFWPAVFKQDGVRPTVDHLPALRKLFNEVHVKVDVGGFPYVPFLKAPFYFFVGQKGATVA